MKSSDWTDELGEKIQHGYFTDKKDWRRELETLIKELLKTTEHS